MSAWRASLITSVPRSVQAERSHCFGLMIPPTLVNALSLIYCFAFCFDHVMHCSDHVMHCSAPACANRSSSKFCAATDVHSCTYPGLSVPAATGSCVPCLVIVRVKTRGAVEIPFSA